MLPQCLKFAFALTFCFKVTTQNYLADNRARYVDPSAAVAENVNASYLELLQEVFPGVAEAGGGRFFPERPARLRNLERPRDVTERAGAIEVSTVQALWFVHAGEHHLALIVNARHELADGQEGSDEFHALAVFAVRPRPRLVDAAEIDFDRFVSFWEESPLLPVRQGETAFWLRATHHNASEGFHSYFLAELRGNRLSLALDEPFGLVDVKPCGSETKETLKVVRERGAFAGHSVFDLHVRTETIPTQECEGEKPVERREVVRTYRLRWDARRKSYQPTVLKEPQADPRRKPQPRSPNRKSD